MPDMLMQQGMFGELGVTSCQRCSRPCKTGEPDNPDSRLFKRAKQGLCMNCIVTEMFQSSDPFATIFQENGPSRLLDPRIQKEFAGIMGVGHSDGSPAEIDWQWIVDNWEMPFPKRRKRNKWG